MSNIRAMRAFVAVAKRGSFAAAATHLGISTSSISRLVHELEDWLGTALLRRTTRHVTLTDTGEHYLQRCREIVAATDELFQDAKASSDQPRGRLHVAAAAYPMRKRIAPLLPAFLAGCPDVQLRLHLHDKPVDLIAEGVDVAIRIGDLADSAMIARRCGDVTLRLSAAPAFLAKHGAPKSLDELPSFPCLVDTTPKHGHRWPIGRKIDVDGPVTANDGEIIRQMTLAGLGISYLPDFFVEDDIAAGRLFSLFPEQIVEKVGIYALFPARRQITAAARAFVDFMVENMGRFNTAGDI
jgi:DNA-binding transcriptional LysR family regulator